MTNSYKKEYPFVGYAGFGGGAPGLSYKSAASKKYIDDVFSTYLYTGNASTRSISNGIDLSGEGGLVWTKSRSSTQVHGIIDTVRGVQKVIAANDDWAEYTEATSITAFNNNGYTMGSETHWNGSGLDFASWSFRKSAGFCDIVTWTGNATADRQISHNLGCVPGCILIKQTSGAAEDWAVYQRGAGSTKALKLNKTNEADTGIEYFQNTDPTATNFTIGVQPPVNGNGNEYIAYLFAGGEEQGNASVDFDGNEEYLSIPTSSDFTFGTGDFTIELWFQVTSNTTHQSFITDWDNYGWQVEVYSDGKCQFAWGPNSTAYWSITGTTVVSTDTWHHLAVVRNGNTFTQYLDGSVDGSFTSSTSAATNGQINIGYNNANGAARSLNGKISNLRVVKGQALYTSAFTPTSSPLTTTSQSATASNVKLLCCNDIGASGFTKSPSPLELTGSPQGNTASPFAASTATDTSAVFGADEDQNIIKCGSYLGNGSSTGPVVNLGWEPQWVLIKRSSDSEDWMLFDSMRSITTGGNDYDLRPNLNNAESTAEDWLELTSTGFQIKATYNHVNDNNNTYIYVAIRRPDGYVGKPPSAGTDAFAMDTGNSSATIPAMDSTFPVDFALLKAPASSDNWALSERLIQGKYLLPNNTNAVATYAPYAFDSNVGWSYSSWINSTYQSWMWKRGQGFDTVNYTGDDEAGREIRHSLNAVPEMIWVKDKSGSEPWAVYHYGANGGTTPWNYYGRLNTSGSFSSSPNMWNQTAPTSTDFTVIADNMVNGAPKNYIAMLFSSVTGISKVGYYTGSGSGNTQTITTGFQPRFVLIKDYTGGSNPWYVLDTTRGWASGNDGILQLDSSAAEITGNDWGAPTATGFTVTGNGINLDSSSNKYIYYAHA